MDAEHDARSKELELLKRENETRQQLLRERSEKLEQQHAELKKKELELQAQEKLVEVKVTRRGSTYVNFL